MTDAPDAVEAVEAVHDEAEFPFLVKVLITYQKLNEAGIEQKGKDEVIFKLDAPSARMPWYVLRNYSVPKYLTKKYGPVEVGWQRIYEIKILKLISRANPADISNIPLRVMTMEQLEIFVVKWELAVPVREFYSVVKSREMVALRQKDEEGYKKHLAEYREGQQRSYPELDTMRGDAEVQTATVTEFDGLNTEAENTPVAAATPSEVMPTESAEADLLKDKNSIPGPGDQPAAVTTDPFAAI